MESGERSDPLPEVTERLKREFWCFISYRHADNKEPGRQWASWLHQALETYEVPADLVGTTNERGHVIPDRIFPVFRDEEELPADAELSRPIEAALRASRFLIVLCSPRAVVSRFVGDEILRFKQLGKQNCLLAVIIDGEPNASDDPLKGGGEKECFPHALRYGIDEQGRLTNERVEPIAADFRLPDGLAGWTRPVAYREALEAQQLPRKVIKKFVDDYARQSQLMLLKIVAGVLGVPLGVLTQRDRAYQLEMKKRRATVLRRWLAAIALLVCVAFATGWIALRQAEIAERRQKDTQRTLAQNHFERGLTNERDGQHRNSLAEFFLAATIIPKSDPLGNAYRRILVDRLMQSAVFGMHDSFVIYVGFSPDGTRVVTGSLDGTVRLWDARSGASVGTIMNHEGFLQSVALSPDGTRVITGSLDGTARLWDARSGASVGTIMKHEGHVQSVAFGPDGTRIITGSEDKTARLWDAQTGASVGAVMKHDGKVFSVAFSPDGTRVVTGSQDKTARLWDAQTGTPVGAVMKHDDDVSRVAFNPDGSRMVTGSRDMTARLWDANTGTPVGEAMKHDGYISSVAFSPDGTRVVTGSEDKTARLWDAQTGTPVGAVMKHEGYISSVAFSPDGTRVVTGSEDKTARQWDAQTGTPVGAVMQHDGLVFSVAFSPDGIRVITGSMDLTAQLWDAQTGASVGAAMKHDSLVTCAAFSPDGTRVVTGSYMGLRYEDKTTWLWNAQTGASVGAVMNHERDVNSVSFSPDGTTVVTGSDDGTARLWDAQTGLPVGTAMKHDGEVYSVAFSLDGTRVVTRSADKTARLWDARTGSSVGAAMKHDGTVFSVEFSLDGTCVVTGSADKTARLWDAWTGASVGAAMKHDGKVFGVAFSPDCAHVATASEDMTARLWDVQTGTSVGAVMQHEREVRSVAFSPDGKRVVTRSEDTTVHLWDVQTGASIGAAMKHDSPVTCVAFSPDGTRVVTGGADKTARIWDAQTGVPVGAVMNHEGDVTCVAFSTDSIRVVTGSVDKTARIWDVSVPVLGDISNERLQLLFEIMTGCRLIANGPQQLAPIPADEFIQLRKRFGDDEGLLRFQREHPARLAFSRTLSVSQTAEDQENWFAATFHLRRLSQIQPDKGDVWHRLGRALAQQRKWLDAVSAFRSAVRLEPSDQSWKYDLSLSSLATRDPEQFRTAAESLLSAAEKSDKDAQWDEAVWLLALSRPGSISTDRIEPIARRAVEKEPENWSYRETLGAILFRAGDYDNALVELEKVLAMQAKSDADKDASDTQPVKPSEGTVWTQTFLALTHHALGHTDVATRHRATAARLAKDSPSTEWRERLRRELLLQELTETLGPAATN